MPFEIKLMAVLCVVVSHLCLDSSKLFLFYNSSSTLIKYLFLISYVWKWVSFKIVICKQQQNDSNN